MAQSIPKQESIEWPLDSIVDEARTLRDDHVQRAYDEDSGDGSPQAFFEKSVGRDDVREILRRLAKI
jgi:hypothetical protein